MISCPARLSRFLVASLLVGHLAGCGDDDAPGGGGAGGEGAASTSSTTASTGSGTSSTGGQGGGGQGGGGGGATVACGALSCTGGEACVETVVEPSCSPLAEGDSCPDGTTETACGGAGLPCCCEPPPEPVRACAEAPGCNGDPPTCSCFDPCDDDDMCQDTATPGRVVCEPPPAP